MEFVISEEFRACVKDYEMLFVEADIVNGATPQALTDEINRFASQLAELLEVADINKRPGIAATRAAYKACGKDPNRYRPSQEQLMRRIVRGLGLYTVDAVVDAGNLISLMSGCSLGAFDRDKIEGETLTIGVGREGEPYEGIGRGELNIAGMPVIRDAIGGIGTPTSDNERTKISSDTRRLVMTIQFYGHEMSVADTDALVRRVLETYCSATNISSRLFSI